MSICVCGFVCVCVCVCVFEWMRREKGCWDLYWRTNNLLNTECVNLGSEEMQVHKGGRLVFQGGSVSKENKSTVR